MNKLFSLSKYHPVGVMVYGSAEFMGVDWETIVKIYRSALAKRSFDTLHEHATHFIRFLQTNTEIFDDQCQQDFIEMRITVEVYGSAEFMGVDWETIVKIYRSVHLNAR